MGSDAPILNQVIDDITAIDNSREDYRQLLQAALVSYGVSVMVDSAAREEIDTYLDEQSRATSSEDPSPRS